MGKYITEYERYKIEGWLEDKVKISVIAKRLNKCVKTIYNEIKRGTVTLLDYQLREYQKYCADVAQRKYNEKKQNKGRNTVICNDNVLCEYIGNMLLNQKLSPYAVAQLLKQTGLNNVCEKTIYNYVHSGLIANVTIENLPYRKKKKKQKKISRIPLNLTKEKILITERPAHIEKRGEYGHWEMDTVYSGKNRGKACLLVLTERMTRQEYIFKMPNRTSEAVVGVLDNLERKIGKKRFRNIFKTITCDNGMEFSDIAGIEKGNRTTLYFCHAYASSERGSNENQNKLIRRFIKKGEDIGKYSSNQIQYIEDWINMLPRHLFGGLSSLEYMQECGIAVYG